MTWSGADLRWGQGDESAWVDTSGRPAVALSTKGREGAWNSPVVDLGSRPLQPDDEIIVSCIAATPGRSYVRVKLRVHSEDEWHEYQMGELGAQHWQTSIAGQDDTWGRVKVDVFEAKRPVEAYQVRVELVAEGVAKPRVFRVSGQAVRARISEEVPPTTVQETVILDAPKFTQMVQDDAFDGLGGGGRAWCSAATTAMAVAKWGAGPTEDEIMRLLAESAFEAHGSAEEFLYAVACGVYDHSYDGTGNWLVNVEYAGLRGLDGWLYKFPSLVELERLILHGVPAPVSISWKNGEWVGAAVPESDGHLALAVGVTKWGDIVLHDPRQEPGNIRVKVGRRLFDKMWRRSGRLGYVIKPVELEIEP